MKRASHYCRAVPSLKLLSLVQRFVYAFEHPMPLSHPIRKSHCGVHHCTTLLVYGQFFRVGGMVDHSAKTNLCVSNFSPEQRHWRLYILQDAIKKHKCHYKLLLYCAHDSAYRSTLEVCKVGMLRGSSERTP